MNRIRSLRLARGLTQDQLVEAIGGIVTKTMLSKYETEQARPSPTVASALAAALGVKAAQLFTPLEHQFRFLGFRKHAKLSEARQQSVQAYVTEEITRRLNLLERLGLACSPNLPPAYPVTSAQDAEAAADYLRQTWGLGREPLPNLTDTLERHGVFVLALSHAPEGFHGIAVEVLDTDGKRCAVAVAFPRESFRGRQRSTLGHEIGHVLLEIAPDLKAQEEKWVQRFSSALLMPASLMVSMLGEHRSQVDLYELLSLKPYFGTSAQAITYRAKDLSIFGPDLFTSLFRTFSRLGWRREEPEEDRDPENSPYWQAIVTRAHAEGIIGTEEAQRDVPDLPSHSLPAGLSRSALMKLPPELRRRTLEAQATRLEAFYRPGHPHRSFVDDDESILLEDEAGV